jgi:hypothetical protein
MCRLRFFEIDVKLGSSTEDDFDTLSFLMGSLCISLTSPATLEHLKFDISFDDDAGLGEEGIYETFRVADAWRHLDSITSHPTGSRLQRVDININYLYSYGYDYRKPDKNEVINAVLNGLPLLRSKGFLFVEAVWE